MKRIVILAALLATNAWGATTTVTGTIYDVDGSTYDGLVYISISHPCSPGAGGRVGTTNLQSSIVAGALSVALHPNDDCTPAGTSYRVRYSGGLGSWNEVWSVTTSGTPVDVSTVVQSATPAISATLNVLGSIKKSSYRKTEYSKGAG